MSATASIASCFKNYGIFTGRSPRSALWYFFILVNLVAAGGLFAGGPYLAGLLLLPVVLPAIAVCVRRLHDLDKSGWYFLLYYIPIVGLILFFVWNIRRGTEGANRFGPDPLNLSDTSSETSAVQPPHSKTEELIKLRALFDAGTLSQAEFDQMKTDLISN